MNRFEWNWLRAGDPVVVHDPDRADLALVPGVVSAVEIKQRVNDVGVRLTTDRTLWPSLFSVHRDPPDPGDRCWRCDDLAGRPRETGAASPVSPVS